MFAVYATHAAPDDPQGLTVLGRLLPLDLPFGRLESDLGLIQDLFDPQMDQAGLNLKFRGQVTDGNLVAQVTSNRVRLHLVAEIPSRFAHGILR
jgi:hypothetical protein